jgi:hypothetical protein
VEVVAAEAAGDGTSEEEVTQSASATSPLELLRGRRAELDAKLYLDLPVPRWEELLGRKLWVRYRPGDAEALQASVEKRENSHRKAVAAGKQGDAHRVTKANADFLVKACVAVYDLPLDVEPPKDLSGIEEYPTFGSEELSEAVGAPKNAVETARKVYATDGDLMVASAQLLEWSAQATPKAESDFLAD